MSDAHKVPTSEELRQMPAETVKQWNENVKKEFRENGGKLGGPFAGMPALILHTRGRKSGKIFDTPLAYLREGGKLYVFGSNAGKDTDPSWIGNIKADPNVTIEIDTDRYQAKATLLQGSERDRIFDVQAKAMPNFADYEKSTSRQIPVVEIAKA